LTVGFGLIAEISTHHEREQIDKYFGSAFSRYVKSQNHRPPHVTDRLYCGYSFLMGIIKGERGFSPLIASADMCHAQHHL
jgi:hypothetical protein